MTITSVATPLPRDLVEALDAARSSLGPFAACVHWYEQVSSTNDVALRLAEGGVVEGTTVIADRQTAGRGRRGRAWASPAGAGLYVSVVLRPSAVAVPLLTLAAGVGIADGLFESTGLRVTLKWPNDVYAGGRKLAGILAEGGSGAAGVAHVVLGFGINLLPAAYPPDVAVRATSLEGELGRPAERGLTLARCLAGLARRYDELHRGGANGLLRDWRSYAAGTLGRPVACTVDGERMTGLADDVDDDGALRVRSANRIVRVVSGEVIWL